MSNLIPTPRTDKNGRVTIRHMKPEGTAGSASLSAAKPSLGSSSGTRMTDREFLRHLDPENQEYWQQEYEDALQNISEHSPTVMQDVIHLLSLGNESGSKRIREEMLENLETIVFQRTQGKTVSSRIDGYEGDTSSLKEALAINWSVGSLSSEATGNFFYSISTGVSETIALHKIIKSDSDGRDYESDLRYWRAASATALLLGRAETGLSEEQIGQRREMVEWMESKEYLGDIIRVGMERGLKDVSSIKAILESDVPTSLSSGAL